VWARKQDYATVRVKVAPEVALSTLPTCIPATIGHGRKFVGGHAARRCG
jgi:hypothetical protein